MSADLKIFHEYTDLSFLRVKVDDYEIMSGDLMSLQVDQSFKSSGLVGKLEFKDTFDIFNNSVTTLNNNNVVTVSFKDFMLNSSYRTYRITNISHRKFNERFRVVTLSLIDEITWTLSQSYEDYYYKGDCAKGAMELINKVCSDLISTNKLTFTAEGNDESASSTFLANSSQSVLDSVLQKLAKFNLRLFQTRDSMYIKELIPSDLEPLEFDFTDKTMNNKYLYKIFDRDQLTVSNLDVPKALNYRIDAKEVFTDTKNLEELRDDFIINTSIVDTSYLQGTSIKMGHQASLTEGQQKMKVFDNFMNTNRLQIAVAGTLTGGLIDTVIKCTFNGVVGFNDITTEGDSMNSGYYYVSGISDLFIGEKFVQRITTSRAENIQPRDKS